ncbi:DUF3152 domain-containing protein [Micromonospora sp. CPCC 206060]|uniref:DUF3152 domain-containing protein n=1 Tax=Micromonospora sp. CPCC 206060 TaxID=3122406 RepID=UPI002FF07AB6
MRTPTGRAYRRTALTRGAGPVLLAVVAGLICLTLTSGDGPGAGGRPDGVDQSGERPGGAAGDGSRVDPTPGHAGRPAGPGSPVPARPALPEPGVPPYPVTGPGTFQEAAGPGPVHGTEGELLRYRVAVEDRSGVTPADFAAAVDGTLGDARSWIASGRLRMQRVPADLPADFTVLLATPATSERICAEGGLVTERYTSCRLPGRVVINLARWMEAVPDYGAPLDTYRAYVINHEVGHELGEGHEDCPGPGRPAPVMQQQTYGLRGCVANAWPYLDGVRYAGPIVP